MLFEKHKDELFKLLLYAKENVPFYRDLYSDIELKYEEFNYEFFRTKIPVVHKSDISEYEYNNLAEKYVNDRSKLRVERTSGSTGTPFVCYKDNRTRIALASNLMEYRKFYSDEFTVNSQYASFYGIIKIDGVRHSNEIFVHKNVLYIPVLELDTAHLTEIWKAVCDFKPLWLMGTATSIYHLAECVKSNSLPEYKFGFIELNGELVSDFYYEYIKDVFKCSVTNHYGMRELWCIGYSCPKNHLHISDKTVYVEDIYDEEVKDNLLLCTSLNNYAAPFIRYQIGDRGIVKHEPNCCFGGTNYTLDVSNGRISCFFECGGKKINLFIFALIIKNIVDEAGRIKIIQYQVLKTGASSLIIKVVVNSSVTLNAEDIEQIKREIKMFAQAEMNIEIQPVQYLNAQENGKTPEFLDISRKCGEK